MKNFDYTYKLLQNGVLTNSDGTNVRRRSSHSGLDIIGNWDKYLEDAIVPEITYTETDAVSVDRTVKAWTYYCDSLSGCVEGTEHYTDGDGSAGNPWRSVDFALRQIYTKFTCVKKLYCCYPRARFQLRLKGVLDYEFQRSVNFFYWNTQILIISPWDNDYVVLTETENQRGGRWHYVSGVIYNYFHLNIHAYFYNCTDCIFNHFWCQVTKPDIYGIFNGCRRSKFIDFSAEITNYKSLNRSTFFFDCYACDVIELNSTGGTLLYSSLNYPSGMNLYNINVNSPNHDFSNTYYTGTFYGIVGFENSHFYNCNITAKFNDSNKYGKNISGFFDCHNSTFYNCSANVSGILNCEFVESSQGNKYFGYVDACGFFYNSNCLFHNCMTTNQCEKCADETYECRTPDF